MRYINCNSPREKRWIVSEENDPASRAAATEIEKALGIQDVTARLLVARGYRDAESARAFLCMESELMHSPYKMQDMERAVNRIRSAIRKREKITIYGDYDVDGVTSVSTLYLYLRRKGAEVDYYIPHRIGEGYGVSAAAVEALSGSGTRLMITVDTGITATAEVELARTHGMDVIVTDHHECREELPAAVAVVNPHRADCAYPFKDLAGVGVVFKLICAYEESTTGDRRSVCVRRMCEEYADLVAIGTIADVMPIRDENKLIVSYGLSRMESHCRPGLAALMEAAAQPADGREGRRSRRPQKITSGYIGYTIAPRINAAGRVRCATDAVELFLSQDPARTAELARGLCEANRERQAEENRIVEEAYNRIEREQPEEDPVIVLDSDDWHHGVIGIVASRITERYGLPSILISFSGCDSGQHLDTDIGKGSGRSIKGMNLVDALVYCSDTLVKYGGHELAAGLSVTRGALPAFREKINAYARERLNEETLTPAIHADCTLSCGDISMGLCEELRMLEPYGVGNPVPVFVLRGCHVFECTSVSGGKHTRLSVGDERHQFNAMCFSRTQAQMDIFVGDCVDLLFNLDINEYNGRRSVQLIVKDIRQAEEERVRACRERERFEEIWSGALFGANEGILPDRRDFAAVYTLVSRQVRSGCDSLSHRALLARLRGAGYAGIGYIKLKVIIRVLQELNLMGIEETSPEQYHFSICFTAKKTDLEKSTWLHRLRSQMREEES